jgi:uncharacterized protein
MEKVVFHGIEIDRCLDCRGLWFGELEKEALRKMRGADKIDVGDAKVGREFNKVDMIDCPHCRSRMIRMVDLQQHHIWFEHCTICGGSFFDAGEFRDLRHQTILDFFRDLMVKERK